MFLCDTDYQETYLIRLSAEFAFSVNKYNTYSCFNTSNHVHVQHVDNLPLDRKIECLS